MIKKYLGVFISSLVLSIAAASLRGGSVTICGLEGVYLSSLVGFIVYTVSTLVSLNRYGSKTNPLFIALTILLGASILDVPFRLSNFQSCIHTLGSLLAWWFGIVSAYFIYISKETVYKFIISALSLAVIIWFSFFGYQMWLHKIAYDTYTGKMELVVGVSVIFQDSKGQDVDLKSFAGNYVILDFWSTTCGVCIKKLPLVEQLYNDINKIDNIKLYSVFCPISKIGQTPETGDQILRDKGCSFPSLYMAMDDPLRDKIGVKSFPMVLIFDPSGIMVFKGGIEAATEYVGKLRKDEN